MTESTVAFTFPGQGSQAVGMGRELALAFPSAREVFEEVDEALKQNLSKLMWEGPEDDLTLTENAQPALMAVSLAVIRVIEHESGRSLSEMARFVAGHSLGEYAALAAAQALSLTDTARLLKRRGQAMQRAVPVGQGAMSAILGLSLEDAIAVAQEAAQDDVCSPANDNALGQVVLSGSTEAVQRAGILAKDRGAKRAMPLPVSAPFHCSLMAPAADEMREALSNVVIAPPVVPIVANVSAREVSDPETIRGQLVEQITNMVRWRESVLYMAENGVTELIEAGSGKVLTGLAKRITKEAKGLAVGTPAEIEAVLKAL